MSENYDCVRYGSGTSDFRLVLRQPIQTCDSASPRIDLARVNPSVRPALEECLRNANNLIRASNAVRGSRTTDEILTGPEPEKRIGLGTRWPGTGVNPQLDDKVAPVRDLLNGFIPGNVVHAVDPGTIIDLGRVFAPHVQDAGERESFTQSIDDAEEEWKKDPRSLDSAAGDLPPSSEKTKDARPPSYRNCLPGTARGITTAQYQDNLRKGRVTHDQAAPVARARMTSAEFAALRVNKGAA